MISSIYRSSKFLSSFDSSLNKSMKRGGRKARRPQKAGTQPQTWQQVAGLMRGPANGGLGDKVDWNKLRAKLMSACRLQTFAGSFKDLLQVYYLTPHWKRLSASMRSRFKICQHCGSRDALTVHHKHYATVGREVDTDLVVLCWPCHQATHDALRQQSGCKDAPA